MSATMLKLIEPSSPLSEGFTDTECTWPWGPGCVSHPNQLRLVEYNAQVPGAPMRPALQCRGCGDIYSVKRTSVHVVPGPNPFVRKGDDRTAEDVPFTLGMAKSMLREKTGAIDILLDEKDALYVKLAEWQKTADDLAVEVRRLEQVVRDRDQQAEDVAAGRLILDEVVDVVAEANAWLKVSAAIPNTPSREEYQYDRGYWAAMVDIMRHLHYWEGVGLKTITDEDFVAQYADDEAEDMIRKQLTGFFADAAAGWGEDFPEFEEWSA